MTREVEEGLVMVCGFMRGGIGRRVGRNCVV